MPIQGRSLGEVGRIFCDHLNEVLHTTITPTPLSLELSKGQLVSIRVRGNEGQSGSALLKTRYGDISLYIGQICKAERDDTGIYTLSTTTYRYALSTPSAEEPFLRWEYLRNPGKEKHYCRHHLQGRIPLDLYDRQANEQANLQSWHLPTGWVPLEDVLRFCIVDLGVTPLSDKWSQILTDSYQRFRAEFSSPGQ